jgi:hypothetical protein
MPRSRTVAETVADTDTDTVPPRPVERTPS